MLNVVLGYQSGMIRCAAGGNHDFFHGGDIFAGPFQFVERDAVIVFGNARRHRIAERFRLFDDLLDHEMVVAALFSGFGIPVDLEHFFGDRHAHPVSHPDRIFGHDSHFPVTEDKSTPCPVDDRRNVRCDKVFAFTQANDQRIVLLGADYLVRIKP